MRSLKGIWPFCSETEVSSLVIFDNYLAICFLLFSSTWMLICLNKYIEQFDMFGWLSYEIIARGSAGSARHLST